MIDPRFANVGAVPFVPGYGAQQTPIQNNRSQRRHRHHKNKHGAAGESPLSRDESIHKVDHGHHHFQQNEGVPFGAGFGVPYGVGAVGNFYQQQPFSAVNYGFNNQFQGNAFDQGQLTGGVVTSKGKHHRRHRHQRQQNNEASGNNDQSQAAPEPIFGQRSSSALASEAAAQESAQPEGEQTTSQRHHHHHHTAEHSSFGKGHQSRQTQGHTQAAADGYGHINEDLIFIERGEHSPHRQQAPPGYEYKGKIEVQGIDKEYRSKSYGHAAATAAPSVPISQGPPPTVSAGPCPPGWQQMILTSAPGIPCPSGGAPYTGHVVGANSMAPAAGIGFGVGGASSFGAVSSGGGLANLAASLPIPPQGQLVADYIVESGAAGSVSGTQNYASASVPGGSSLGVSTVVEQYDNEQVEEHVSGRATIIEVWQKKTRKTEQGETKPQEHISRSRSRTRSPSPARTRSPKPGQSFDFNRFRNEILAAIERIVQSGGSNNKMQWSGHDGGTQTQIHPSSGGYERPSERPKTPTASSGEVRVIVQPIQPVFYMPRQTETTSGPAPIAAPIVGPAPAAPQPAPSGAPNVVYIPRNVYVPVIKPVFVPRERVIVRPQVIHVARPVLVDRPVPVTQRPIIIDRERPVPVPVRTASQATGQAGGSRTVKEEYVYRDNLPVAYGGRCAEYTGGVNYGYMPTEQTSQFAASSTQEVSNGYETQGPVINVTVPNQFQHSQSAAQLTVPECATFTGSYNNLARTNSASVVNVAATTGAGGIEILDPTVNSSWQRTDKSSLMNRYGGPAADLIQKTDQVEQQMYQELRQRSSSGGIQRSQSTASYGSGSGVGVNCGGAFASNISTVNY